MESVSQKDNVEPPLPPDNKPKTVSEDGGQYDIISVGFGPAALSIAIAMRDRGLHPRVLFLEKQPEFGWHTGMLLPGTKMQISFIKDLATIRNPRSHFTFLNYLHHKDRLVHFTNLSTHLPFREEFNDYMKWCASHFNDWVRYGQEVLGVVPVRPQGPSWPVESFKVVSRDIQSGHVREMSAKHVIVASGREPAVPAGLSLQNARLSNTLVHSSAYLNVVPKTFHKTTEPYRFAVVGGGQSAVEIAEDLSGKYPNSKVSLITRASALKPSDDSPFVNEVFDPNKVDNFFSLDSQSRKECLRENKVTNYSVVRLPLLESLYEKLYRQKLLDPNPANWSMRLITDREISGVEEQVASRSGSPQVKLRMKNLQTGEAEITDENYDLIVLATGYRSNSTSGVLKQLVPLLDAPEPGQYSVERNYRLRFQDGKVGRDAGIWLQGWCESTHGISDSLLSILAVRGGELLDSILGGDKRVHGTARL